MILKFHLELTKSKVVNVKPALSYNKYVTQISLLISKFNFNYFRGQKFLSWNALICAQETKLLFILMNLLLNNPRKINI